MNKTMWVQNEIIKVSDKIQTNHDYQLLNEAKQVGGFQKMQLIGKGPQEGKTSSFDGNYSPWHIQGENIMVHIDIMFQDLLENTDENDNFSSVRHANLDKVIKISCITRTSNRK